MAGLMSKYSRSTLPFVDISFQPPTNLALLILPDLQIGSQFPQYMGKQFLNSFFRFNSRSNAGLGLSLTAFYERSEERSISDRRCSFRPNFPHI